MKKSKLIGTGLILALALSGCGDKKATENASPSSSDSAALLTDVKTTQFFTEEKLPEEDVKRILAAGVNAPSAMNTQPWHFTAITDEEVTKKLSEAMSSMRPPASKDGKMPAPPSQESGEAPKDPPERPEGAPEGAGNNSERPPMPEGNKHGFSKAPNKAGIGDAPLTIVISCEEGSELSAGLAVQNMSAEAQLLGYGTKILTSPTIALKAAKVRPAETEKSGMINAPKAAKICPANAVCTAVCRAVAASEIWAEAQILTISTTNWTATPPFGTEK